MKHYKSEDNKITLVNGDCLEVMDKMIEKGVKVDAIITDVPYQTTSCDWDLLIPFNDYLMLPKSKRSKKLVPVYRDEYILKELKNGTDYNEICEYFDNNSKEGMWQKLNKLIKGNGAIVLFGSQPFTSALVMSNPKMFKYEWVWDKKLGGNSMLVRYQPYKIHENILVFSQDTHFYNAIMKQRGKQRIKNGKTKNKDNAFSVNGAEKTFNNLYYPRTILEISNAKRTDRVHPTQKPVALMEYLIRTYTNEGQTVLDFTMGSGTTGVACMNTSREFIGIEKDEKYFEAARKRIILAVRSKKQHALQTT